MKLTIIEDDGKQRIAKDAEGNLWATYDRSDKYVDEKPSYHFGRITSYSITQPSGQIAPYDLVPFEAVVRPA